MENTTLVPETFNINVAITLSTVEGDRQPTQEEAETIIREALSYVYANGTNNHEVAIDAFTVGDF